MSEDLDTLLVWTLGVHSRPMPLKDYQLRTRAVLSSLHEVDARFHELAALCASRSIMIPKDLGGLDDVIAAGVFNSEHPEDYLNLLDSRLGPLSLSRIGFSMTYCSAAVDLRSIVPVEQGGLRLRVQGSSAGSEPNASVALELPINGRSGLDTPRVLRLLLRLFIEKWECNVGGVSLRKYQQAVQADDQASYAGQWLFYLPFPNLAKCLPSDIRHEPFADGILIETTPHAPDANNPADVAAGKRVRDVLDEFGLVNDATYAIEGWPPDREEALYEQFISGAPPGRKYAVHCVNFDGYDPDRKVLLYAKLFRPLRRHPKEWGLRGWDGPVLNEAKRQVRAAAKAGGVPVEWHIGLEEPARQVRQLLADYTGITEQQLRVIHTPLDEALRSSPP